jgi:adenosylcobinamide kinase/adenosylcobinamide-phosphate guanylyltransferase
MPKSVNKKIFVIGGCRSGKSSHALELAEKMTANERIFIATCVPQDGEMRQRVAKHRQNRNQSWKTVEAPLHLPQAIMDHARAEDVVLVDCLTLWISNLLMENENPSAVEGQISRLVQAVQSAAGPLMLVSNEVGTGIVPENKLARRYRDLVGSVNQEVASHVDKVVWVVAGIPVTIKG